MRLLFKQRFFSWFDRYDIYDEEGNTLYVVKGKLAWGHLLKIFDSLGNEVGMVKQRIFTLLPKFEIYKGEQYIGCVSKKFAFFEPQYEIDFNGWSVEGNFFEWEYSVFDRDGGSVAQISKELFKFTDTYVIDVADPANALYVLMFVLAVDAEKCSRDSQ